jgi:hypothetical protein
MHADGGIQIELMASAELGSKLRAIYTLPARFLNSKRSGARWRVQAQRRRARRRRSGKRKEAPTWRGLCAGLFQERGAWHRRVRRLRL